MSQKPRPKTMQYKEKFEWKRPDEPRGMIMKFIKPALGDVIVVDHEQVEINPNNYTIGATTYFY
ncbi:hypothetical protein DFA_01391 [Cavenderia fasciculata]|uniref:Uncharacterized protein n=1 Tax=Cavenderia fasciculata TaxID=261658 RepID=F4PSH5_CACFS|nr:uncharacterized protein DFA_01391 [Cavenderia fasciculata]EGG21505.1 hypothetical protein DFA_01391 [Cavenderia fasciculata]|eukprot:XP_004359355.1 hypothetical protein DFA_01391 [Cavenderia fasciculata]